MGLLKTNVPPYQDGISKAAFSPKIEIGHSHPTPDLQNFFLVVLYAEGRQLIQKTI